MGKRKKKFKFSRNFFNFEKMFESFDSQKLQKQTPLTNFTRLNVYFWENYLNWFYRPITFRFIYE